MFTKLILILLIPAVWYGLTVFTSPELASRIDALVWLPGFSENLRGAKNNFDTAITDIPSVSEIKSGALDIKESFTDGVETTKGTIDSIRDGAQQVENTYNDAKETFEDAKEVFDDAAGKVDELKWVVDSVSKFTETSSNQ